MSEAVKLNIPLDQILNGECIQVMKTIPSASIDCIFADPPYNLQLQGELRRPDDTIVDGVNEDWDKFKSFQLYDQFCRSWLKECHRLLRKNGTIWVIGSYHNIFRIGAILQDLGFWILNDIVWRKSNPMPNFKGRRFTNAHETLIWAAKDADSKYCFNYQAMKTLNDDIQMRSDWFLPLCTGHERLRNEHGLKLHPTQKPESLLYRVILSSTNIEDVVLDPFAGTGTTLAVAKKLQRRYIGIERHPDYMKAALRRVNNEKPLSIEDIKVPPSKREIPRVPFGNLIEQGFIQPGTILMDRNKRVFATVTSDSTVISGNKRGSIHKIGALVTNSPSCNGWTFWHFERNGGLYALDILRNEYNAMTKLAKS
ncbi:site-specific DNA-methyltransferase [Commensalibacter sp. W8133]|uniref:site-specific DNA-methyltransferase n=1 Tax=Commensalibacter sp. W8133 TaxID=2750953 RepID=UPI0018DDE079|nr:site-specific DNA-methyltransferase [Commensalibacter sp. W8133]MBI0017934.1 site-specific DNA-methyltransferase [Commensalibacter sp. W8133]